MKYKDGKQNNQCERRFRTLPTCLVIVALCGLSFYLGGFFYSRTNWFDVKELNMITKSTGFVKDTLVAPLHMSFPECSIEYQDYTPCTDPKRWKKYGYHRLEFMERHCPPPFERKECLVPPPKGYKPPIKWPKSRDEAWYWNVPYDWINNEKSEQRWLKREGDKFIFLGGGTMFPDGVGVYVDLIEDLIPEMKNGSIRTAMDTGCGVASWGGHLLERGILTMSLAPRDNHEAQVQFALERGIPSILGIFATQRLPFPSSAFDMVHCSRCLIPWTQFGGIYLMEIHRILRPGGFWVLSGPPVNYENRWEGWNTTEEEQRSDYQNIHKLLTSLCFKLYNNKDDIAIWQKTSDQACYDQLTYSYAYPPKCDDSIEPDSAWYTPLRPCLVVPRSKQLKRTTLHSMPKWPTRLFIAPKRISEINNGKSSAFKRDLKKWKVRVKRYKKLLPALGSDEIRNVMDMRTTFGGFAAMLINDPIWVMNVVSSYAVNTLPVIYDRGLIGTYHDWCEAFSTYPRTYDLLHADGLFASENHRCEMKHVLLEMDRILRPNGYAIIRDSSYLMDAISAVANAMRWDCRKEDTEHVVDNEKILICKKKLWYSQQTYDHSTQ